ncbi:hypothetical protein KCU88_g67, partial [Aureobasidium melanogenum]
MYTRRPFPLRSTLTRAALIWVSSCAFRQDGLDKQGHRNREALAKLAVPGLQARLSIGYGFKCLETITSLD